MNTDVILPDVSMPELDEVLGKIGQRQKALADIFAEAGPEMDMTKVKSLSGSNADKVAELRKMNLELAELGAKRDDLETIRKSAQFAALFGEGGSIEDSFPGIPRKASNFGELFLKSEARRQKGTTSELDIELKTLMTTTAGWTPETTRTGLVIMSAQRPIQVTDLIPTVPTNEQAYVYMEETTFTNNAAEVAEGGTYGEAAFALTEQSSMVRKIGVWLPITDEQLEDEPAAQAYINARMPFMVQQRLDGQIMVGNGTAPNVRGVLNVVGIQTQAKGADPSPDAFYKAMVKVRVTGRAIPSAAVVHPTNWQDVKLLRTADGIYIWGSPSEVTPDRIWGLNVAQCDALTVGTAVVGDFANFSLMAIKRGIEVKISDSHSTYFVEGKQAIRADMRAALVWLRPAAFCTVTGL